MRKLLFAVTAFLAVTQAAFAINLTFKFDVYSSGPSIYACNAGIVHTDAGRTCQDRITGDICSPGCNAGNAVMCPVGVTPESCVCSGGDNDNQGGYRLDYLNVKYAGWVDNSQTVPSNFISRKIEAGNSSYASVFPEYSKQAFENQITQMSVHLGSEQYGAKYFLDVCYRGPQIDYSGVNGINFAHKAKVTVTNLSDNAQKKYIELSGLKVKAVTKCYMQDSFDYCAVTNTCTSTGLQVDTVPSNINSLFNKTISSADFVTPSNGGMTNLINRSSMHDGNGARTPRFCVTRYYFDESVQASSGNKAAKLRNWSLQAAEMCTYTEINEPAN